MIKRNTPGYAIGGLAGGENKSDFWKTVAKCCEMLPEDKPRYVMGIGYAEDCLVCALLGADMFDCVFATRTARFGTAFTQYGMIKLRKEMHQDDFNPICQKCTCYTCKNYSRAYLASLMKKDTTAIQLISIHNVHFLIHMLRDLRQAVLDGTAEDFSKKFLNDYFKAEGIPEWINEAMEYAGVQL